MQMDSRVEVMPGGREDDGSGGGFLKRGTKREASESDLNDLDRFEKRLRMLSLRGTERKKSKQPNSQSSVTNHAPDHYHPAHPPPPSSMQIDDTRDRVYISDLDAELADLEEAEAGSTSDERLIFLPDIEKHFSKIPQQVLAGGSDAEDGQHRELVLYDLPRSLTVEDEAQDSVRKAIIESRQRAREKAVEDSRQRDIERHYDSAHVSGDAVETAHGYSAGYSDHSYPDGDPDAMDMDIG